MKAEQYIIKYANARMDAIEADDTLTPERKLEKMRQCTLAVNYREAEMISADEAIRMIGDFQDRPLRDNLLVTMGCRAGHMEAAGEILVGGTLDDENRLAEFCGETVDAFLERADDDTSFDEWIERALMEKFGH